MGSGKVHVRTLEYVSREINQQTNVVRLLQKDIDRLDLIVHSRENELVRLLIQSMNSRARPDIEDKASELQTEIAKAKVEKNKQRILHNEECERRIDFCAEFRELLVSKNMASCEVTKAPEQSAITHKLGDVRNPYAVEELDQ